MRLSNLLPIIVLSGCVAAGAGLAMPLDNATSRPTPLHFGVYVTPEKNPIQPAERFTGYHSGLDFEVSEEELDAEVPVYALCDGEVIFSGFAEGYGGVLVQRCTIDEEIFTVLYGHVSRQQLAAQGTMLMHGQKLGVLAAARSEDSGGNRKHLHLGMHKGEQLELLGYVQSSAELKQFINPAKMLGIRVTKKPFRALR